MNEGSELDIAQVKEQGALHIQLKAHIQLGLIAAQLPLQRLKLAYKTIR